MVAQSFYAVQHNVCLQVKPKTFNSRVCKLYNVVNACNQKSDPELHPLLIIKIIVCDFRLQLSSMQCRHFSDTLLTLQVTFLDSKIDWISFPSVTEAIAILLFVTCALKFTKRKKTIK